MDGRLPPHLIRALEEALHHARRLWVASDFDGTLTPIVSHPARATNTPRARRALSRLAALPRVRVAVISGRGLVDLERRIGVPGVHLAGLGGIDTRDARGLRRARSRSAPPAALLDALESWCARYPGAWIERKGCVAAVHFRAVRPTLQPQFARGVRSLARPFRARIEVQPGRKVLELRPRGAPDKAVAFRSWLGSAAGPAWRTRRAIVFFGDDENDEPLHALVRRLGGVAVAVGRKRSQATHHVAHPDQVAELLAWLARAWTAKVRRDQGTATGAAGRPPARAPRSARREAPGASAPRAAARS